MYLKSSDWYQWGKIDQASSLSQKSTIEESFTNSYNALEPKVEEEFFSNSSSSMSLEAQAIKVLEYSSAFNMRLVCAKKNSHRAQLYKDPMSQW